LAGRGEAFPFFSSPELVQRLDLLRHLTENSELIPLVKGPDGSGKSSLIQQLIRLASDTWVIANIEANPMMQPDQLLAALAQTFPGAGDDHPMDRLIRRFGYLRQEGRLPVVIIDDAHLLPEATIITLLRMHERRQDENIPARILLFAQPEIDNLLKTPQIQAMNILSLQTLDMPRLSESQAEQFIKQLLLAEDQTGRLVLSSGRIEKIIRDSDGLPGRIAGQVLEAISSGAAKTQRSGGMSLGSPLAVAGLISVGVILTLMLLFQDSINTIFGSVSQREQAKSTAPAQEGKVVPLTLPAQEPEQTESPGEKAAVDPVPDPEQSPMTETPTSTGQPPEPVPVELPVVGQETPDTQGVQEKAEVPAIAKVEPMPEAAPPEQAAEQTIKAEESAAAPQEEAKEAAAKAAPESQPEKPEPKPAQAAPKTTETAPRPGREAWLLQQRPSSYTLQLIGLQEEAAVSRFLERHKLPGQTAYFRTSRQGKPWFPVLYGVYPNRDAAVAARDRLPASLKRSGAWPRSLESVQKEIRSR
jgi:DamX protein